MVENKQFVKCPVSLLASKMSSDAKILCLLLIQEAWEQETRGGKKDEAVMTNRKITEILGWGKNKPVNVIKELISNGYVSQSKIITKEGHRTYKYHVNASVQPSASKVDVSAFDVDEKFSNCVGTLEKDKAKGEVRAESPKSETKGKNEVVEVFNYDQPFEFDENTEYWEKGLEHVDEKTFNNFLLRRFPENENAFDAMIKRMKDDNKIGWQTYADGTSRYNVYQITKDEYDRYYNEAVSKCLMAV